MCALFLGLNLPFSLPSDQSIRGGEVERFLSGNGFGRNSYEKRGRKYARCSAGTRSLDTIHAMTSPMAVLRPAYS